MAATAVQAQLSNDTKLVAQRDGLASGNARTPTADRVFERHFAVITPVLRNKPHEAIQVELGAPVEDAHCAFEAQELLGIAFQLGRGHDCCHVGNGSETSRSD
jgi:hypothetical protein